MIESQDYALPEGLEKGKIRLSTNTNRHLKIHEQTEGVENHIVTLDSLDLNHGIYSTLVSITDSALKSLYEETIANYNGNLFTLPLEKYTEFSESLPKRYEQELLNKNVQKLVLWNGFGKGRRNLLKNHDNETFHNLSYLVSEMLEKVNVLDSEISDELLKVYADRLASRMNSDKEHNPAELAETIITQHEYATNLLKKAIWNHKDYSSISTIGFLVGSSEAKAADIMKSAYELIEKTEQFWQANIL